MPRSIDPVERVLAYPMRKNEYRKSQRDRAKANARRFLEDTPELEEPLSASLVETVDELPEEDEQFLGRQFRVVTDDEEEEAVTMELAQLTDGTLEWREILQLRQEWKTRQTGSFGSPGFGDGQFGVLSGIGLANSIVIDREASMLWVTEQDRLQRFNLSGTHLTTEATEGSGNGQVDNPGGMAVTYNGVNMLLLADGANDRLQWWIGGQVWDSNVGSSGSGNTQFDFPTDVAIDEARGRYFVADTSNNRIIRRAISGNTYQTQWGTLGTDEGEFSILTAVAIDNRGRVWTAETGNHDRIQVFTQAGTFLFSFGGRGSAKGKFRTPRDIAFDGEGNAWITDFFNDRVQVFTDSGQFIAMFGSTGDGDNQFDGPSGIDINGSTAYIVDSNNGRVVMYDVPTVSKVPYVVGVPQTGTWNPGSISSGQHSGNVVTYPGARFGDYVEWNHDGTRSAAGVMPLQGLVTAEDTIRIGYVNATGSSQSVGNGTYRVRVTRDPS